MSSKWVLIALVVIGLAVAAWYAIFLDAGSVRTESGPGSS